MRRLLRELVVINWHLQLQIFERRQVLDFGVHVVADDTGVQRVVLFWADWQLVVLLLRVVDAVLEFGWHAFEEAELVVRDGAGDGVALLEGKCLGVNI